MKEILTRQGLTSHEPTWQRRNKAVQQQKSHIQVDRAYLIAGGDAKCKGEYDGADEQGQLEVGGDLEAKEEVGSPNG